MQLGQSTNQPGNQLWCLEERVVKCETVVKMQLLRVWMQVKIRLPKDVKKVTLQLLAGSLGPLSLGGGARLASHYRGRGVPEDIHNVGISNFTIRLTWARRLLQACPAC